MDDENVMSLAELLARGSEAPRKKKGGKLGGGQLAGGNPKNGRVENDYYATDPKAVKMLFDSYPMPAKTVLEPCVGEGHIAKTVKEILGDDVEITAVDIVDRGYPNVQVADYLNWETDKQFDLIITNPPYSLAQQFADRGITMLNDGGRLAMFLKLQFLEGKGRQTFYKENPPKYIYVFSGRMPTWNNGSPIDPETGDPWKTTMCHAWFIWEKGFTGEPTVRWL